MIDGLCSDLESRDRTDRRVKRRHRTAIVTDGGDPDEAGAERHRILRQLRQQLEQHPAVEAAWGIPEGEYAEVQARLDPTYFGRAAESATLRLVWHPTLNIEPSDARSNPEDPLTPGPRTAFDAMFRLHYSESGGYDCGFHNGPNPHVDGWFHFQERHTPDAEYEYTPASLEARTPVSALWEILDKLDSKLRP